MNHMQSSDSSGKGELTKRIQAFWTRHVNAERIMGSDVSGYARGEERYFLDLENQRYRSHRHLLPWIMSMQSGKSTLEIGSGVGLDTFRMVKHGLRVTAIDLTHIGSYTAKERFQRHGLPGSFNVADACSLPFPDNTFDYIYSFGVLHHVANTEKSIAEVYRVLKPGGEARIMLYNRRSLNEIVHRLTGIPFEDRNEFCPVVRRFTISEVRTLFNSFRSCTANLDFIYGEGYGKIFRLTPRWLYRILSRRLGWHIMICAQK